MMRGDAGRAWPAIVGHRPPSDFQERSMTRMLWLPAMLLLLSVFPCRAQDDSASLDRIEVTGSRISYRDLLDTPAIGLTRQGDYLVQSITLVNDTRSADGRRNELHQTIAKLLAAAGGRYRLLHGDGYPITLDRSNYRVALEDDSKRPDVSRVPLRVRAEVVRDGGSSGHAQVQALRAFVQGAERVGRTEIDLDSDTALGMNRPERYRYELIREIADDSRRIATVLGSGCTISLDGLNSRIEWERVGPIELLLYVPYTMVIEGCRGDQPAAADRG
jgi:hypothetical protein